MKPAAAAICGTLLILCVAALAVVQFLSLAAADRYLERSLASQEQSTAVSAIAATVAGAVRDGSRGGADRALLAAQLKAYRASVEHEAAVVERQRGRIGAALVAERNTARHFEALALQAASASDPALAVSALRELSDAVAAIAAREQAETVGTAASMARLRLRMNLVGLALAGAAVALAVVAGLAFRYGNRQLAQLVRERTAELETKSERLAEVDRSRRLFFAKLSHELRTPITVVRGEAEVALRVGDDAAAMRGVLGEIVVQADVLDRRLEELLGIARADDGRLVLERAPVDLAALVKASAATVAGYAGSNDVVLDVRTPSGPLVVDGDARWLQQAALTIIDNGIKFSGAGTLRVELSASAAGAALVIADQGPGIAEADLPHVFDPYYQSATPRSRSGVGLGLALARWVVEQHGGTIRAGNAAAGGCVVTIELPLAVPA
ncbi:HAMP domain-containing histidine kinase [Sphingosinicellaceae bacterium]|nr:HAMP domain-containing histidine kinase [Sphingosinicellaceae bacterium]